jgi:hypothetical protein
MIFSMAFLQVQSRFDPSRYVWAKLRLSEHVDVPHIPSSATTFRRSGKADIHIDGLRRVSTKEDPMRRTALSAVLVGRAARDVQVREEGPQDDGFAKVSPST